MTFIGTIISRGLCALLAMGVGASLAAAAAGSAKVFGEAQSLGNGTIRTYAELGPGGAPSVIGVQLGTGALEGLPAVRNTTSRCFDLDGNGRINDHDECEGDTERKLSLPVELEGRADVPFRWVGINWNPEGHPPHAWSVPHFDFHFYIASRAAVQGIRVGPCQFFINCEDRDRARKPVPATRVHHDHVDVDAAVSMMGNHLVDLKSPELTDPPSRKFTHTWIFGAYDGHITFYEPMITHAFLMSRPDECVAIKQPQAWEIGGYYPTRYCMRYLAERDETTISLEGLQYRSAE